MTATVEMDKLGRFVLPKKIRELMHLKPGDKLELETLADGIVFRFPNRGRGLYIEDGLWVYDSGVPFTADDVNRWIQEDRERRIRYISGESLEP